MPITALQASELSLDDAVSDRHYLTLISGDLGPPVDGTTEPGDNPPSSQEFIPFPGLALPPLVVCVSGR